MKEKIEKVAFFFLSNYPTKAYSNIRIAYRGKRKGTREKNKIGKIKDDKKYY